MHGGYSAKNGALGAPILKQASSGSTLGDDLPQICETCLGPNPYVRMTKLRFGEKLCKISNAPYQAFKWKAGPGGRYKETIICYDVAAERNICQTCLNDMQFGLPVGVRDALLKQQPGNQIALPRSNVGQQYFYEQQAQLVAAGQAPDQVAIASDPSNIAQTRQLDRFARAMQVAEAKSKVAFRNLPKLCSFWLSGSCTRVIRNTCPFRPCCGVFAFPEIAGGETKDLCKSLVDDLTANGPAAVQKTLSNDIRNAIQASMRGNRDDAIRKRVQGEDDLTNRYLGKMKNMRMELLPPADTSVLTLWLGGVEEDITEADIREVIYPYGQIVAVNIIRSGKCAFVEYIDRPAAEYAASQLYKALMVKGRPLNVNWAKPRAAPTEEEDYFNSSSSNSNNNQTGSIMMPAPPGLENAPLSAYALQHLPTPSLATATGGQPPPPPPPPRTGHPSGPGGVPPKPPVPPPSTSFNNNNDSGNKRQKTSATTASAATTAVPAASSFASHFSGYGDDEDEDDVNNNSNISSSNKPPPPTGPRPSAGGGVNNNHNSNAPNNSNKRSHAKMVYPSMNPARLGAAP